MTANISRPERILTTLGAAFLTYRGLRRGGLTGRLMAAVGSALAARGGSGFCPLYRALGLNFAWRPRHPLADDVRVDTASEDSFPASDPPSWNAGHDRERET